MDLWQSRLSGHARKYFQGYHLLAGLNPDGLGHMVVAENGIIVHDPNPSRKGIIAVEEILIFVPLADTKDKFIHWMMRHYDWIDDGWVLHGA